MGLIHFFAECFKVIFIQVRAGLLYAPDFLYHVKTTVIDLAGKFAAMWLQHLSTDIAQTFYLRIMLLQYAYS